MEQLTYHVVTGVARHRQVRLIKWGGTQKWLPLFLTFALVKALIMLATTRVALIHLGDAVLAPLGWFLRLVSRKPVTVMAHGLDIIYPNRFYQSLIPACIRRADAVICNSRHTQQACLARGVRQERTVVIPGGVIPDAFPCSLTEEETAFWLRRWGLQDRTKRILLTTGRLVPRKGGRFFVSQVLPALRARRTDWVYLLIGEGPEREAITAAVRQQGLEDVVRLLGQVSKDELQAAYALADVFVMPNIALQGDVEGFGIVTLEARVAGVPVVAADLEGIADSFEDEEDGALIPAGDAPAFVAALDRLLDTELTLQVRQTRRSRTVSRYGWDHLIEKYLAIFQAVQEEKLVGTL